MAAMRVGGAQAVRRAMDVVRTVAQIQRSGANLSRVARACGLSTPTTYRLLRALTEERLLTFNPDDRTYAIGSLAFELGLAALPEAQVDTRWRAIIADVARRTRLTSYLIARSNDEAVCLYSVQGAAAIRAMPMEIGQRAPLGIGAGSLAILASLDDEEVARILDAHKERYGVFPGGRQDPEKIRQRIAETRARGYSISAGTVAAGVVGVGVLAPSGDSLVPTAVTVSALANAFDAAEAEKIAATIARAMQGRRD